jgi:hypothetical protein
VATSRGVIEMAPLGGSRMSTLGWPGAKVQGGTVVGGHRKRHNSKYPTDW